MRSAAEIRIYKRADTAERRMQAEAAAVTRANQACHIGGQLKPERDEVHTYAQARHAAVRAEERYGVQIDRREQEALAARMRRGGMEADLIRLGESGSGSIWAVLRGGREMLAVLSHSTGKIATFLPPDAHALETDEQGRFVNLKRGGELRGRAYWRLTRGARS